MDERDREQEQEMLKQVHRYEQSKQNNENAWFDSDNYADIIDWYYMHNKEQQAREVVLEAYHLYPHNEDIVSRYVNYLCESGKCDEAIKLLQKELKENGRSIETLSDLVAIYSDMPDKYEEALTLLKELIKLDKNNYFYYFIYGKISYRRGKIVTAERYLRKAITLNVEDRIAIGYYSDCADIESLRPKIESFLKEKLQDNIFNDALWVCLGIVLSKDSKYKQAIEALNYAIAIKPEGEIRHSCKADCFLALKDFNNAEKELLLAIKYADGDVYTLRCILANLYIDEEEFYKAIFQLEQIKQRCYVESSFHYVLDLAYCYYKTNQNEKGLNVVKRAIKHDIPLFLVLDFAQEIYNEQMCSQSEDIFEYLITTAESNDTIELASATLAALKMKSGNTFEAIKIMETTLEELKSCSESFWYAFLRITCEDARFDKYTMVILSKLIPLKSFPHYIKDMYPDLLRNPNYKRCLKI